MSQQRDPRDRSWALIRGLEFLYFLSVLGTGIFLGVIWS